MNAVPAREVMMPHFNAVSASTTTYSTIANNRCRTYCGVSYEGRAGQRSGYVITMTTKIMLLICSLGVFRVQGFGCSFWTRQNRSINVSRGLFSLWMPSHHVCRGLSSNRVFLSSSPLTTTKLHFARSKERLRQPSVSSFSSSSSTTLFSHDTTPPSSLQHREKPWYQLSSVLMASVALLLLFYFPQFQPYHPLGQSSSSPVTSVASLVQRRQMNLGTQFAAASGFGIASYLFSWLQHDRGQEEQESSSSRLLRLVHVALMVFSAIGLFSIPGEMGMMKVSTGQASLVVLSSSQPQGNQQITTVISALGVVLSIIARGVGLWTSLLGWKRLGLEKDILSDDSTSDDPEPTSNDTVPITNTDHGDDITAGSSSSLAASPPLSRPPTSVDISSDSHGFKRMFMVSKAHRNQNALFYRNLFLLLLGGAGSNMMEAIFRCRVSASGLSTASHTDVVDYVQATRHLTHCTVLIVCIHYD